MSESASLDEVVARVAEAAGIARPGEEISPSPHKIGLGKIASVIHPYPTQGEVLKKAAAPWRRGKLTPGVKRLFERWFGCLREGLLGVAFQDGGGRSAAAEVRVG